MTQYLSWVLIVCVLCPPVYSEESPVVEARLTQASGDVTLGSQEESAEGPPVQGEMTLVAGDRLHTGPDGHAEICIDAKTMLRLEPGSQLRIKQLSPKSIVFALDGGTVLAMVKFDKRSGAQLSVETPTAVAAVRGTEFVVQQGASDARVGVLDEGHVAVTSRGSTREVLLHYDQETRVRRGHAPEKAHTLQRLYPYKVPMATLRDRVKYLRKHWNALNPDQKRLVREAWIKTHSRIVRRELRQRRPQIRRRMSPRRQRHRPAYTS